MKPGVAYSCNCFPKDRLFHKILVFCSWDFALVAVTCKQLSTGLNYIVSKSIVILHKKACSRSLKYDFLEKYINRNLPHNYIQSGAYLRNSYDNY